MPASPITASNRVAVALRVAIDDGTLLPGEHIRQEQWAERLGVSRVPVREALKGLASEGLLDHDPNRGYFVQRMDRSEMHQVYRLRQLVEPEIMGNLEPFSPAEVAKLEQLSAGALAAFGDRDIPGGFELDGALHATIWEHCPDRLIVREAARLWALCDAWRISTARAYPDLEGFVRILRSRHRLLIGAIGEHDLANAQQVVIEDRQAMLDATAE